MRESRNKMQPEISLGTPEEVGLVQKRVIITNGAVLSYQVLHEDQRGLGVPQAATCYSFSEGAHRR